MPSEVALYKASAGEERDLLLLCAGPLSETVHTRVHDLCRSADWDEVLLAASRHGLLGLLHHRVNKICRDEIPPQVLEFLDDCAHRIENGNYYLVKVLKHLSTLFRENGIAALSFGDIILAQAAYGDLSIRECKNLEFVVAESDMAKAKKLVELEGFRGDYSWDETRQRAELKFRRCFGFDRNEDGVHLWLYAELDAGSYAHARDWEALQATAVISAAENLRSLSPENLLLHACVRLQGWGASLRLISVVDILKLLESAAMDWPALLSTTRRLGAQRRLLAGLTLVHELLGGPMPAEVKPAMADTEVRHTAAQVRKRLFADGTGKHKAQSRWGNSMQARERIRDKVRFLSRSVLAPTREDWSLLPLPSGLYYVLKPIRMLASHGGLISRKHLAEYMPTPMAIAEEMLKLAEAGPEDTVYDLGCGDGRIVILAAQKYGARGLGIDLDPDRIADATANARAAGVQHLVRFTQGDVLALDLSPASVVTMFLSPQANLLLRSKLRSQLAERARIVSRSHDMGDWVPEKSKLVACDGALSRLHLWRIPRAASHHAS